MGKIEFTILSRAEVENLIAIGPQKTIIISVYGTDEQPANIKVSCPILRLQFDDIEKDATMLDKDSELYYRLFIAAKMVPFNIGFAKQILDFVQEQQPERIIVHCHAGICRSAAIAAALSKIMYNEDDQIFKAKVPNMLVYKLILEYFFCHIDTPSKIYPFIFNTYLENNAEKFML